MFKMVHGTRRQLAARMNRAMAQGYTQLFREFPNAFGVERDVETEEHFFLMQKPQAPSPIVMPDTNEFVSTIRQAMVAMGFGDRLPPEPEKATVLNLVPKEEKKE